jgi:hypothetical protein
MSLFHAPIPVGSSRVKGAHVYLRRAQRELIAIARTLQGRTVEANWRRWLLAHYERIRCSVEDGASLPVIGEPKINKRARKRGAA